MFNGHTISVVMDLNILGPAINDVDFMTIAAITTGDYPNLPNIYNASILVPPTEILMRWADGDPLVMQNEYPKYLMSKDPDDMIVALLASLTKNNVVLYIPMDDFNVFGMLLLTHIYYTYGITCNLKCAFTETRFTVDESKLGYLIGKFYMMDLMEPYAYLESYPGNAMLPAFVINKLAAELHPFNYQATFDQYAEYFNNINRQKLTRCELKPMFRIVNKEEKK